MLSSGARITHELTSSERLSNRDIMVPPSKYKLWAWTYRFLHAKNFAFATILLVPQEEAGDLRCCRTSELLTSYLLVLTINIVMSCSHQDEQWELHSIYCRLITLPELLMSPILKVYGFLFYPFLFISVITMHDLHLIDILSRWCQRVKVNQGNMQA